MQELDATLWVLELATYPGEMEAGGPPESLAPPVGSKSWKEDVGDIDEDGGHLYDRIKMLCEEGHEPEPVLTHGREGVILIISNLSLPAWSMRFLIPTASSHNQYDCSPIFFSFSEWETTGAGGESSNPGGYLCKTTCNDLEGCPPPDCGSSQSGCCHPYWGSH